MKTIILLILLTTVGCAADHLHDTDNLSPREKAAMADHPVNPPWVDNGEWTFTVMVRIRDAPTLKWPTTLLLSDYATTYEKIAGQDQEAWVVYPNPRNTMGSFYCTKVVSRMPGDVTLWDVKDGVAKRYIGAGHTLLLVSTPVEFDSIDEKNFARVKSYLEWSRNMRDWRQKWKVDQWMIPPHERKLLK